MGELLSVGYAAIDNIEGKDYFGGAAAGIAINGTQLGLETGLLALFGDDQSSLSYIKYLTELGVDLTQAVSYPSVALPRNEITSINQIGQWHDNGIAALSSCVEIDKERLQSFGAVHLASPHFSLAKKVAHEREGILTYTPGPKLLQNPDYLNLDALRRSQIVFLNEPEWNTAKQILNVSTPGEITDYGPSVVVVTLGKKGSSISYLDKDPIEETVPTTERPGAETTGAGDAYSLGFILAYLHKLPLRTCAEIGTALSARAIKRNGVVISTDDISVIKDDLRKFGIR